MRITSGSYKVQKPSIKQMITNMNMYNLSQMQSIIDTVNLMGVYNLFDKAGTHLNEVESLCEAIQTQACFLTGILHMTQDETYCNSIYQSHPSLYHQDVLNAPSLQHMLRILIYYKIWNKFFSFKYLVLVKSPVFLLLNMGLLEFCKLGYK